MTNFNKVKINFSVKTHLENSFLPSILSFKRTFYFLNLECNECRATKNLKIMLDANLFEEEFVRINHTLELKDFIAFSIIAFE